MNTPSKFNTQHSTLNIPLKVQLLLNQLADGFYSFTLALDVFMDIITYGIEVVEEIDQVLAVAEIITRNLDVEVREGSAASLYKRRNHTDGSAAIRLHCLADEIP